MGRVPPWRSRSRRPRRRRAPPEWPSSSGRRLPPRAAPDAPKVSHVDHVLETGTNRRLSLVNKQVGSSDFMGRIRYKSSFPRDTQ